LNQLKLTDFDFLYNSKKVGIKVKEKKNQPIAELW